MKKLESFQPALRLVRDPTQDGVGVEDRRLFLRSLRPILCLSENDELTGSRRLALDSLGVHDSSL
jgi:hypothetical protein